MIKQKKLVRLLVCAVTSIACIFALVMSPQVLITTAKAMTNETNFEKTDILDDLNSLTVDGKKFDIRDYPYVEYGKAEILSFVEYCYSYKANMRDNYGLYIYVYNPYGSNYLPSSKQHKIQMAVSYDNTGKPNRYEKFDLKLCSKVEDKKYPNLFYKFRVIDRKIDGKTFGERVNSIERRYDVSGIELLRNGDRNSTEYYVGGTYKFTGYATGYGADIGAKSTLSCKTEYLETIELNVKHTFYRTKTSSKGTGYQNQLDTVYFAVPQRFFKEYGTLQRIKSEWYEYKTNDIVVTSNQDFYNKAQPYLGIQTGALDKFGMTEYNKDIGISLGQNAGKAGDINVAEWGWNLGNGYLHISTAALYSLFEVNNIAEYDPYADITENGGISSNALYDYILNYNKTYNKGRLDVKDGTISADLFTDDIDAYRKIDTEFGKIKNGYSYYDFDADVDLQKLSSWQETNPSFWDNWINWGLWDAMTGNIPEDTSRTLSPIYTLKSSDLNGTNANISDKLMVNANDVTNLKSFYNKAVKDDCVVILFRFATSDYYSAAVDIIELNQGFLWSDKFTKGQAYRAWESVFMDFDIIQLSFKKDEKLTVIPVVSNPIDIINGITPPVDMPNGNEWWKLVLGIILFLLLLILLFPILPWIINGALWLICLPFRLIGAVFNGIGKSSKKGIKFNTPKKIKEKHNHQDNEKVNIKQKNREYFEGNWLPLEVIEDIKKERYLKIVREDFPKDFYEDPDDWEV